MRSEFTNTKLSVRALGGRWSAPWLSVWAPILTKLMAALAALVVLAMVGFRAAAHAWSPLPGPPRPEEAGDPSIAASATSASRESVTSPPQDGGVRASGILADGRVVLNTADEEQLVRLPGIGPTRARAILALRQRLGKFRSVDQLRRVKGIGRKTLQRIAPHVVVDAPQTIDVEKDAA